MEFFNLIKKGAHTAIVEYVKNCKCLSIDEEIALINRGNHIEIMSYLANHYLEPESFDAFLKRGNLNEMRFYLHNPLSVVYLSEDVVVPLLKMGRGVHDAFVDYLLYNDANDTDKEYLALLDNVQCLLIEHGDHCAIRHYICRCKLQPKARKKLLTSGIAEDILVYNLRHS